MAPSAPKASSSKQPKNWSPSCIHIDTLPRLTSDTTLPEIIITNLYKLAVSGEYLHMDINYGIVLYELRRRLTQDKLLCTCYYIQPYQNTCRNETTRLLRLSFPPKKTGEVSSKLATNNPFHMVEKRCNLEQALVGGNSIARSGKETELWVSCFASSSAAVWHDCWQVVFI